LNLRPQDLSGQMYLSLWNSCRRMYSLRSARPPFRVLFLFLYQPSTRSSTKPCAPRIASKISQLLRQGHYLDLASNSHLEMSVELAMPHKIHERVRAADGRIEEGGRVVWVDVLPFHLEMGGNHLGQRPCCRRNHALHAFSQSRCICTRDLLTLAPSLAKSQSIRPFRNLMFVPCLPMFGHLLLLKRPILDQ
jgi:hypothetical protein